MNDLPSLLEQFHREGFLVLRNVLSSGEVEILRRGVERAFEEPSDGYGHAIRVRMFERGEEFENLIDHPNMIELIEAILGADCHLIAQNALKTGPGESVASGFHADGAVYFPFLTEAKLDPEIRLPCFVVNMNYYLVDVPDELGPTQLIPGSHRSGRNPDRPNDPTLTFEGRGTVNATGNAGDVVLWHDQVWHRGMPNSSTDKYRIVQQGAYGKRFISQRFYPFINYHMAESIIERANPRRRRLLGLHGRGAYG